MISEVSISSNVVGNEGKPMHASCANPVSAYGLTLWPSSSGSMLQLQFNTAIQNLSI